MLCGFLVDDCMFLRNPRVPKTLRPGRECSSIACGVSVWPPLLSSESPKDLRALSREEPLTAQGASLVLYFLATYYRIKAEFCTSCCPPRPGAPCDGWVDAALVEVEAKGGGLQVGKWPRAFPAGALGSTSACCAAINHPDSPVSPLTDPPAGASSRRRKSPTRGFAGARAGLMNQV